MGAHNNPNGNCQPVDADRKGRGEDVQNASQNTDPYITTQCAVCCKKEKPHHLSTIPELQGSKRYQEVQFMLFHTTGIEPMIIVRYCGNI
jgi:hypothetical protein